MTQRPARWNIRTVIRNRQKAALAIFHLHVKNISRGEGRSVLAAAAYRAGEVLANEAEEGLSAFGGRRDVIHTEIRLPSGAPPWMADRAGLWNAVEVAEIRKDARLAKEIEFALPLELSREASLAAARAMADAYTSRGFVVDMAIHDDGLQRNPHVHLLMPTRTCGKDGFGLKIRSADGRQFVIEARVLWETIANKALNDAGLGVVIDRRSHAKRKLERMPGVHRGPDPAERRAKREQAQRVREQMIPREDYDPDLPVPDPDGMPLHPTELAAAEEKMLDEVHRPALPEAPSPDADVRAAQALIDRQNAREMSDDEAAAYRLAPDNMLDWLDDRTTPDDMQTLGRWENHLDWLDLKERRPAPVEEGRWQEPERDRS